jgi:UDP-N-acetylmuramate dehydrogenase
VVVEVATSGVRPDVEDGTACGGVLVTVAAGETWDDLLPHAVERGWLGIEALSGIPGAVGATPIQNVGAYGQEVAQTIASVRVWDRTLKGVRTFANADCGFGYRHSRFKADRLDPWGGRHVVLDVTFQLPQGTIGAPVRYTELAGRLGVAEGERAPIADVRDAVLALRAGKGMVLDPADHDTWSAGSFFTNPVVDPAVVPEGAPAWPQPDGSVKTSAAWLIEHAGFGKGHGLDRDGARVSLSTKHTLALTNRGDATAEDLLALAREVRDGVEQRFGIRLVNEPVLVGVEL